MNNIRGECEICKREGDYSLIKPNLWQMICFDCVNKDSTVNCGLIGTNEAIDAWFKEQGAVSQGPAETIEISKEDKEAFTIRM